MRIRAHNLHGYGAFSDSAIILSTGVPDKPDPPSTQINNSNILVRWTDPDHNFEAIDYYQILFLTQENTFAETKIYCDGQDELTLLRKYCEVPMSTLLSIDESFNLVAGDLVQAKVAAHNLNGWSEFSEVNTLGANI